MTDPGADKKPSTLRVMMKRYFGWLRRSVSWKTIIIALASLGAAAAIFVVVGGVDVSADAPDGWLATHGLHFVFKRSVASSARYVTPPDDLSSSSRVRLAAQHFDMVCANCHGRPGFGQSVVALSMSPRPQYLPKVVGQFTDSELYVIVEHGVKYSAMPSWATETRGDEVWSIVSFLRQLPKMDGKTYREMTALPVVDGLAPTGSSHDAALRPANPERNAPPFDEFQYSAPAAGFSDQTIHETPVPTCTRCHGADGSGAATGGEAPNLTIQNAAYLQAALAAYVRGSRKSGFMQPVAAELSSGQIAALSSYYANLPVQATASSGADPALVKRGETIAAEGLPQNAIPACGMCHESQGGDLIGAPHIAGQSATFLRRQLFAMAHGGRGSSVMWNPMPAVAHNLGDKDITALAAYYSGLKPQKASSGNKIATPPQVNLQRPDLTAAKATFEATCTKCHINGGRGDPQGNYPNLTLQSATYVAQSLYAFHSGARINDKMRQVTNDLNLDQMKGLAQYISSLTPHPALDAPDKAAVLRGAVIATQGAAQRNVPACLSCHGADGVAALPLIPRLQGQNVAYLRRKLDIFSRPYPSNLNALNPMPAFARQLTEKERADLAAYFAAAAPLQKSIQHP